MLLFGLISVFSNSQFKKSLGMIIRQKSFKGKKYEQVLQLSFDKSSFLEMSYLLKV